jgi:hypothetical protein
MDSIAKDDGNMKADNGRFFAALAASALSLAGCDSPTPAAQTDKVASKETTNQRLARQKRFVARLDRHILPAPEGEPTVVAFAAIKEGESDCPKVSKAERFNGDGTIIATCSNGNEYRVFNIEGTMTTMPLSCKAAISAYGVDPCDETIAGSAEDKSIETVLLAMQRDARN